MIRKSCAPMPKTIHIFTLLPLMFGMGSALAGPPDLPDLPEGLKPPAQADEIEDKTKEDGSLPSLPPGLSGTSGETQLQPPTLPAGLGPQPEAEERDEPSPNRRILPDAIGGFVEARVGIRTQSDPFEKQASIGEFRAQLQGEWEAGPAVFNLTTDFLIDPIEDDYEIDLETGRGIIDLREANVVLRPLDFADVKIGRQILTWGTGDLLFINDLFPKDFRAFFIGRDDEYLKAPSDAVRASFFTDLVNIDVVYTPRFDADRFVSGERLSYFNPFLGSLAGRDALVEPITPDTWFEDDEIAARASRNIGAFEVAAYAHSGFWKAPLGATPLGDVTFPKLSVYGASVRGPFASGVANLELGFYDSRDDQTGTNPLIPNSEFRYLIGYEREAIPNLTVALQYYAEVKQDYSEFLAAQAPGSPEADRIRHLLTVRLTKLALNQNLTLSLFNFWSPNQGDGYVRGRAGYKLNDNWLVEGGFNAFYGERRDFFGQFQNNSNIYLGVRRSF